MVAILVMAFIPFNYKSAFTSLLTKVRATFFIDELICGPCPHTPLKHDRSHLTTLRFNLHAHQSSITDLATGIYNTLQAHICQTLSVLYGFNVINTFCHQW